MLGRRRESAWPSSRRLHAGVLVADWSDSGRWGTLARRSEGRVLASRSHQSGSKRVRSGVALAAIAGNTRSIYRGFQGRLGLHRSVAGCYGGAMTVTSHRLVGVIRTHLCLGVALGKSAVAEAAGVVSGSIDLESKGSRVAHDRAGEEIHCSIRRGFGALLGRVGV